jgi:hypothetical protein
MTTRRLGRKDIRRTSLKPNLGRPSCHPGIEALEERCLLSAPAIPVGPLPAVTIGLTQQQVAHADAVIDWNATMLQAIWNAATPPTLASRVEAITGVAVTSDFANPIASSAHWALLTARGK